MPTLRRLDDGTRYYYLTWRQWATALAGCGLLYTAVRFSPLSQKWTFTAVLLLLGAIAMAILPLTGNALGLDRYLAAIVRWTLGPRHYTLAGRAGKQRPGGVVLSTVPVALVDVDEPLADWSELDEAQPA
jgi:PrgI family protein